MYILLKYLNNYELVIKVKIILADYLIIILISLIVSFKIFKGLKVFEWRK